MDEHCRGCMRYLKSCSGMSKRLCEKHKLRIPITNADKLRSMMDEELAEWLKNIRYSWTCLPRDNGNRCADFKDDCKACWLNWLKQEAE